VSRKLDMTQKTSANVQDPEFLKHDSTRRAEELRISKEEEKAWQWERLREEDTRSRQWSFVASSHQPLLGSDFARPLSPKIAQRVAGAKIRRKVMTYIETKSSSVVWITPIV
jgi:hypothetical protein